MLTDENNKRFYCEIIQNKSNYRVMQELIREKYHDILDSLQRSMTPLEFEIIILTEFGARREIFLNYYDGLLQMTLEAFNDLIECSHDFIEKKDITQIKFLI